MFQVFPSSLGSGHVGPAPAVSCEAKSRYASAPDVKTLDEVTSNTQQGSQIDPFIFVMLIQHSANNGSGCASRATPGADTPCPPLATYTGFDDFRTENGLSQGQNLALTGLVVPSSLCAGGSSRIAPPRSASERHLLGPYRRPLPEALGPYRRPLPEALGPYRRPLPEALGHYRRPMPEALGPYRRPLPEALGPYRRPMPEALGPYRRPMPRVLRGCARQSELGLRYKPVNFFTLGSKNGLAQIYRARDIISLKVLIK